MIDFRIYRAAFLPVVVALIAVAFSLDGVPEPLEPDLSPAGFQPQRALGSAVELADLAPSRPPGSEADEAAADLVEERFGAIDGGDLSEQRFDASYDGDDVELRNVILTLPGESDHSVVVVAGRDSPGGPGAASSAAATAVLLELADILGATGHAKTIVLVSTAGLADGASGAREFAEALPEPALVDAVVVLSQPGSDELSQPYVVTSSTGDDSTSIQLVRTVERSVQEALGARPELEGGLGGLARLAMPSGLGEQAVMIDAGLDAVAISSAGERPLRAGEDGVDDLDRDALAAFGGAALSAVLAVDAAASPLEHGPDAYVKVGENLLPGGVLALLALTLLLPPAAAAIDGLARAARRRFEPSSALLWAGSLVLPLLGALLVVYLLGLLGLVPRPRFPFDPGLFGIGIGEIVALALIAAVPIGGYAWLGLLRAPADADPDTLAPALGLFLCLGVLIIWLGNPFLALLLIPAAHVWLLAARARAPSTALLAAAAALALLPAALAALHSAGAIGADPWDLVLMIADGQIPALIAVALCPVIGGLLGLTALRSRAAP